MLENLNWDNDIDNYHKQVFEDFELLGNDKNEVIAQPKRKNPIIGFLFIGITCWKHRGNCFFKEELYLSLLSPIFKVVIFKTWFKEMNDSFWFMDEYEIDVFSSLSLYDVISEKKIILFSYYGNAFISWQCLIR